MKAFRKNLYSFPSPTVLDVLRIDLELYCTLKAERQGREARHGLLRQEPYDNMNTALICDHTQLSAFSIPEIWEVCFKPVLGHPRP